MAKDLRSRVRGGEVVLGAFIKIAAAQVAELLGHAGLDFAVIDAEHAPFSLADIDRIVLGGRGVGLPCLVRPPDRTASFIGQCLDLGAAGVLAPHVASAPAAQGVVAAARYGAGHRGFSPSTRAGDYGRGAAADYRARADAATSVWCQIEDAAALDHLDAIAGIDDVDCLFIGRADLALSLGVERQDDPKVVAAVQATVRAGIAAGRAVGIYIGATREIPDLRALGVTVFACGSDQGFVLEQARRTRTEMDRFLADASR